MPDVRITRTTLAILAIGIPLLLAGFSGAMYYERYWRIRHCFNEQGRCFVPETAEVVLEQSSVVWGGLLLLSAVVLAFNLMRLVLRHTAARPKRGV